MRTWAKPYISQWKASSARPQSISARSTDQSGKMQQVFKWVWQMNLMACWSRSVMGTIGNDYHWFVLFPQQIGPSISVTASESDLLRLCSGCGQSSQNSGHPVWAICSRSQMTALVPRELRTSLFHHLKGRGIVRSRLGLCLPQSRCSALRSNGCKEWASDNGRRFGLSLQALQQNMPGTGHQAHVCTPLPAHRPTARPNVLYRPDCGNGQTATSLGCADRVDLFPL